MEQDSFSAPGCFRHQIGTPHPDRPTVHRTSVRGVMLRPDGTLVMVTTETYRDFCFPGGGREAGESDGEALAREMMEETGTRIDPASLRPFGRIDLYKDDVKAPGGVYHQLSLYYLCDGETGFEPRLSASEVRVGLSAVSVTVDEAIEGNRRLLGSGDFWVERELYVLDRLKKALQSCAQPSAGSESV